MEHVTDELGVVGGFADETFDAALDWLANSKAGRVVVLSVSVPAAAGIAMVGVTALFAAFNVAGASLSLIGPLKLSAFSLLISIAFGMLFVSAAITSVARRKVERLIGRPLMRAEREAPPLQ